MVDLTTENNLNVYPVDVNNNVDDNNAGTNNVSPVGHNTGNNNNTDNNNIGHAVDMPSSLEYRDGLTVSSSSLSRRIEDDRRPFQNYQSNIFQEVSVPAGADAMTRALFATINQTNYLIFSQGERLRVLEDSRRAPRRHRRPDSPPARQIEDHL